MVHGDLGLEFVADLNRTIIVMLVHGHCLVNYFQHAHGRHGITPISVLILILAFGSLTSENAMISVSIIQ